MASVLICAGCGRKTALPIRSFKGSPITEHYWPTDSESLSWVCDLCSHHTEFHHKDVQQIADEAVLPLAADRGFWRVEVACSESSCPHNIVGYTQTFGQTSSGELGRRIATADPAFVCASGFPPSLQSQPLSLDFVEWTGSEEYLA